MAAADAAQAEYDAIKEHIDGYMSTSAPTATPAKPRPTRHISHLTQMAAKALHRSALTRPLGGSKREEKAPLPWDEIGEYAPKETWGAVGLVRGKEDVRAMRAGKSEVGLEQVWGTSWHRERFKR